MWYYFACYCCLIKIVLALATLSVVDVISICFYGNWFILLSGAISVLTFLQLQSCLIVLFQSLFYLQDYSDIPEGIATAQKQNAVGNMTYSLLFKNLMGTMTYLAVQADQNVDADQNAGDEPAHYEL